MPPRAVFFACQKNQNHKPAAFARVHPFGDIMRKSLLPPPRPLFRATRRVRGGRPGAAALVRAGVRLAAASFIACLAACAAPPGAPDAGVSPNAVADRHADGVPPNAAADRRAVGVPHYVLDPDGKPVRNANVKANFTLQKEHSFQLQEVFTDENGQFRLENCTLGLGDYTIEPEIPGLMAERVKLAAKGGTVSAEFRSGMWTKDIVHAEGVITALMTGTLGVLPARRLKITCVNLLR